MELPPLAASEAPPADPPPAVKRYITRLIVDDLLSRNQSPNRAPWWELIEWVMSGRVVTLSGESLRVPYSSNIRALYPLVERLAHEASEGQRK